MRIVVSGTHASGKSTLISDFVLRHPEFVVLPDPFESMDEAWDSPGAAMFAAQLRVAAARLTDEEHGDSVIAERGPLDFLAYLLAIAEATGQDPDQRFLERAMTLTADALRTVDLLVVLPLTSRDRIEAGEDEHLELRAAAGDILLDLVGDPDLVGDSLRAVEITGDPATRVAALEAAAGIAGQATRRTHR